MAKAAAPASSRWCMRSALVGSSPAPGAAASTASASSKTRAGPAASAPSARRHAVLHITRYRNTRFWAVWEGHQLLCVTVYKKGALDIMRRLHHLRQAHYIVSKHVGRPGARGGE